MYIWGAGCTGDADKPPSAVIPFYLPHTHTHTKHTHTHTYTHTHTHTHTHIHTYTHPPTHTNTQFLIITIEKSILLSENLFCSVLYTVSIEGFTICNTKNCDKL